jgi:hypothetical protein
MRLMKLPKPGTNIAMRVATNTSAVLMLRNTIHCCPSSGKRAKKLPWIREGGQSADVCQLDSCSMGLSEVEYDQ